ncbi:hypothetical protein JTB14_026227 [Gonioctena quinquepunctata]|nr:hypothetical protein JTB14_026227 [Gonioctena quinquepunctata]
MKKSAKPVKINSSEKILKTKIDVKAKRGKIDKIRKPPVKKIRKQVRIGKSNIDCTVSSEQNEADELKKRQTIEQLLKEVNEEMKAKNSNKTKAAKDKVKVKPKRQAAPNKKLSHSNEVDNVSEKVLDEKIMDSIEKAIKTELIDSPGELSDEIPLNKLSVMKTTFMTPESIKVEPLSDKERSPPRTLKKKQYRKLKTKPKITVIKKRVISAKDKNKKEEQRCKTKLFRFWNGPKRHRVASLNALAKVHCLYENETRGNILDIIDESAKLAYAPKSDQVKPKTPKIKKESQDEAWKMHLHLFQQEPSDLSEGEEDSSNSEHFPLKVVKREKPPKQKKVTAKVARVTPKEKPRKKNELTMDLKDMVVCKRMASLNASAILAASYSPERRASKSLRDFDDSSSISASSEEYFAASDDEIKEEDVKKEEDEAKLLEVNAPNKKVAVILNQDTDVTITGVYVNSTTRSTHHEGYCSIAGMQYRISATSHTQTAATAVATETLLQSSSSSAPDNSNSDSVPSKSYTPLDALSNMQPPPGPGIQHNHPVVHGQQHMGPPQHVLPMPAHQMSPGLHHSCSSAFSSPHSTPNYQIPPGHHPPIQAEPGYVHVPHLNDLHLVIKEKKYDVIGLTETWLHPEIPDRALDIEGYRFIRSDHLVRRGGGTGVYIKNNLVYKVILKGTFDYLEQLWIEIKLEKNKYALGIVYRPPNSDSGAFLI